MRRKMQELSLHTSEFTALITDVFSYAVSRHGKGETVSEIIEQGSELAKSFVSNSKTIKIDLEAIPGISFY